MPSTTPIDLHTDHDASASAAIDKVRASVLDVDNGAIETWTSGLLTALASVIRNDDTLTDELVRLRNLHPEVSALIASKSGWQPKSSVAVATTANITLSGEQTIDGVLTSVSRILVKDQTLSQNNGIYTTGAGAWTRVTDADSPTELGYAYVFVTGGTTQGGTSWVCNQDSADITTLGTTPITFSQVSGYAASPAMVPVIRALTTAAGRAALGVTDPSAAMVPVVTAATLAAARTAMGPWGDALVTATGGSTSATLANRFGDVLNAKRDFGAVGDGTTDDTAAIQAWLNACSGKRGFLPNGTYVISSLLTIRTGCTIEGAGPAVSVLKAKSTLPYNSGMLINESPFSYFCTDITIRGIGFDGGNLSKQTRASGLVAIYSAQRTRFDNCNIVNAGYTGLECYNTIGTKITNCNFIGNGKTNSVVSAAVVAGGSGYSVNDILTVVGGTFTEATKLRVTGVTGGAVTSVDIEQGDTSFGGIYGYGIGHRPSNPVTATGTGSGATFNLQFSTERGPSILLLSLGDGNYDFSVSGCLFKDNLWSGIYTAGTYRLNISDNHFINGYESAIFGGAYFFNISGNIIHTVGLGFISPQGIEFTAFYGTISGNTISDTEGSSITLYDSSHVTVSGNRLMNPSRRVSGDFAYIGMYPASVGCNDINICDNACYDVYGAASAFIDEVLNTAQVTRIMVSNNLIETAFYNSGKNLLKQSSDNWTECSFNNNYGVGLPDSGWNGGYALNRYYSGEIINPGVLSGVNLAANTMYACPFIVRKQTKWTSIAINVSVAAAAGKLVRLGIYRLANGVPTSLVYDIGTVAVDTTGQKTIGMGVIQRWLLPGIYALAVVSDGTPQLLGANISQLGLSFVGVSALGTQDAQMSTAHTFGALPANFGAVTYAVAFTPAICLATS